MRGFRSLSYIVPLSMFTSYFIGGPSSKTRISMATGANLQPVFPEHLQQPLSNLVVLTGADRWKIERGIAIVMLAIIPTSFVFNSVFMNYLLAASLAIHAHWGMDTVLVDYCPRKALPLANIIRYVLTTSAFAGLCYFNYNDMGLTKALKALWAMY